MKTIRTKILFTLLLFSAAVPSMAIGGCPSCKALNSDVRKVIIFCCRWKCFEKMTRTCLKGLVKVAANCYRRILLARVNTQKPQFLAEASDAAIEFVITREVGMVKEFLEYNKEIDQLFERQEVIEVIADCYALDLFIRRKNKDQLKDLACEPFLLVRKKSCLSPEELVYYGDELFGIRQKGNKFDVLAYARKIVTNREECDYKERVEREARKLGFTAS